MSYIEEYAELIHSGKIATPRRIKKLYFDLVRHIKRPQFVSVLQPDGSYAEREYVFSPEHANRPIEFIERFCKHSKGEWMGKNIRLELFQKAKLQAIFGFVDKETGFRRYTEAVTVEGRKNGKSTEISGLANYMICGDGEGGPQIVCAATKLDQAKIVFKESYNMILQSPDLKKLLSKRMADILGAVKTALRISHNRLDDDIKEMIAAAKKEMERVGIKKPSVGMPLVREAIKIYCQMQMTTDPARYDRLHEAWEYRLDSLRKSRQYKAEAVKRVHGAYSVSYYRK